MVLTIPGRFRIIVLGMSASLLSEAIAWPGSLPAFQPVGVDANPVALWSGMVVSPAVHQLGIYLPAVRDDARSIRAHRPSEEAPRASPVHWITGRWGLGQ